MSDHQQHQHHCKAVHHGEVVEHSRNSSSDSSADTGLLLSVTALADRGVGQGARDSREREVLGGELPEPQEERGEPEGTTHQGEENSLASFLSVDKKLFGRLQAELSSAQSELRLKEEQVTKLSRIRDDVEAELEDLTASLFEEANKMVIEANVKRAHAEKALAESEMKVDGLQTEVAALKTLVITSTPSQPNKHLHPQLGSQLSSRDSSAPSSPAKERQPGVGGDEVDSPRGQQDRTEQQRNLDPVLRQEYLEWKKAPRMTITGSAFLSRIYAEDILPCLSFPCTLLSESVRQAVENDTLCLSPIRSPDTQQQPRNCALLQQPRTCRYKLLLPGEGGEEQHLICQLARNRIAAVCDFLTYCRYVTKGMVKSPCNEVYWEIMTLRKQMACARLGF